MQSKVEGQTPPLPFSCKQTAMLSHTTTVMWHTGLLTQAGVKTSELAKKLSHEQITSKIDE
jgi:hypothetical protein